jgi:hypothetical protein
MMLALTVELPDAYWDAFLLQRFPGKTLAELDAIDWARYMRALHAQHIEQIEDVRTAYFQGKHKPTADEAKEMLRHDQLVGETDG